MKKNLVTLSFCALILSFFLDHSLLSGITEHRMPWLNPWMLFLTDFGLLFGVILFFIMLLDKKLTESFILITLTFLSSLEASFLLKWVFASPRPYETWNIIALKTAEGFSFPSMHTAFVFSALPFFTGRLRRYRWMWFLFAILIGWSRVYVGVHYVSDVLGGAFLGYGLGYLILYLENKYKITLWLQTHIKDEFELRRQIGHAVIGVGIIFLNYLDLISPRMLLWVLILGGFLSLLSLRFEIPIIKNLLAYFERPKHCKTFPGRGSFYMVLGALLSILLFPKTIALAAIAIMAIGDSTTNILGRYLGKIYLPYNRKKTLEGALMGIGAASLAAFFFVPFTTAFLASAAALFVETWDLKIGIELDDNVLVPLVAGGVMVWL
ncbi:MAG: hypothetical protein UT55_C0026G0009 [Candidatus Peregrinibacteria bacterium GW2011_GWE2_39_6]|nr:MAG: hypothetical protein UT36_C0001G0081 [Candidatus Peregrinibacteria bacterium GW2011_GWF2_39_17]KKR25879.1 MAG: hypothetical protein UT55_C0026G0009 [Candidatus Peregrinibacteria bacterium GW2011_GWE2_39_6]HCW32422.1 hypothetical protein [Candidatus Peregrinibacteria bacterium]